MYDGQGAAELWVAKCIKTKNVNAKTDAIDLNQLEIQLLFNTNFNKYVSRTVAELQVKRQWQKITNLPQPEDIKSLYYYINEQKKFTWKARNEFFGKNLEVIEWTHFNTYTNF